jgi:hypothetical protein
MTGTWREGRAFAAALMVCLASGEVPLAQVAGGTAPLNLFQLTARADLVVHVRVREGALKFATVEVLDSIKGTPPAARLRIAFRDFNWTRGLRDDPIVFPDGQEEILFLVPHAPAARSKKHLDLFELFQGPQGRITVPAEGAGPILRAVRRLAALASADPAAQIDGLRGLLAGEDHRLIEVALEEFARLRAADPSLYPDLERLLRSPSAAIRSRTLRILGQVFSVGSRDENAGADDRARMALAGVIERARNDREEAVRVEAVVAMAAWHARREVEPELRAIARQDPAQAVRYEAEKALYRKSLP